MNRELIQMLELIKGAVVCLIDGERKRFSSGQEAKDQIKDKFDVESIAAEGDTVVLTLQESTTTPNDMNADWVKEHVAIYGKEPNLFDGM